jgi:hypothetical protein
MYEPFLDELRAQLCRAAAVGLQRIVIVSGDLYTACQDRGGLAKLDPACLDAMEAETCEEDVIVLGRSNGSAMAVRYRLPR